MYPTSDIYKIQLMLGFHHELIYCKLKGTQNTFLLERQNNLNLLRNEHLA